jgi:UDPglucose--hexose-1-phosphate uridylyltransferase
MEMFDFQKFPHRRYNPLIGEWVLVSPHRLERPWQGKVEETPPESQSEYEPGCYLCPGNERAGGRRNPPYADCFVFDNDYSALISELPNGQLDIDNLIIAKSERGICRVICYSPRHNLTMAEMDVIDIERVVEVWTEEFIRLGSLDFINYVQIFENKGAIMGCSNPHPHCQIWANQAIPTEPLREHESQSTYYKANAGRCLLCDYLRIESVNRERFVFENDNWIALVPFWAKWPFETMLLPRRHAENLSILNKSEKKSLADALKRLTIRYDNLFRTPFPYTMGFHQSPTDGEEHIFWHMHIHFYPPLLRSANVQKYMVGYEMLANAQRDFTPENAAMRLREISENHYRSTGKMEKGTR